MEGPPTSFKQAKSRSLLTTVLMVVGGGGCLLVLVFGGLLAPIFFRYRGRMLTIRRESACLTNLQRMGTAIMLYANENDEKLPIASKWMDEIQGHVRSDRALQCPVVRLKNSSSYGYAFNEALSGKPQSRTGAPVWMVTDSSHLERNASSKNMDLPVPARHIGVKSGISNQLLADGSVKQLFSKL